MYQFKNIDFGKVNVALLYYDTVLHTDWKSFLLEEEKKQLSTYKHPVKREEFIATKLLRTELFGLKPVQYSSIGAPSIEGEGYISISHSYNVIGIARCKDFQVGLDLEPIREKSLLVKDKFLNEEEKRLIDVSSIEEVTKAWSGKEALYKLAGRKKIIFKENLLLNPLNKTDWQGKICFSESCREVKLQIVKKDNFIISINTEPLKDVYQ